MHALVTLQGNDAFCGCDNAIALNGSFQHGVGGELGKFKLKIKAPKFKVPKLKIKAPKIKFKAPKIKFKAPKIKLKIPKVKIPNFYKGFEKGIKNVGKSIESFATPLLETASQAIQDKMPQLLDAGLNMLAPGAGSLTSMLGPAGEMLDKVMPGMSEGIGDVLSNPSSLLSQIAPNVPSQAAPYLQQMADGIFRAREDSENRQSIFDPPQPPAPVAPVEQKKDNTMLYVAGAGLVVIVMMNMKKGRR